jgi:hypothetical protein
MFEYLEQRGKKHDKLESKEFVGRRLHNCFAQHRERVRALTERLWAEKAKEVK